MNIYRAFHIRRLSANDFLRRPTKISVGPICRSDLSDETQNVGQQIEPTRIYVGDTISKMKPFGEKVATVNADLSARGECKQRLF